MSYRGALASLAAVLLVLAAFGITSAQRTSHATTRVTVSSSLSDAYQNAHFAVHEEGVAGAQVPAGAWA